MLQQGIMQTYDIIILWCFSVHNFPAPVQPLKYSGEYIIKLIRSQYADPKNYSDCNNMHFVTVSTVLNNKSPIVVKDHKQQYDIPRYILK